MTRSFGMLSGTAVLGGAACAVSAADGDHMHSAMLADRLSPDVAKDLSALGVVRHQARHDRCQEQGADCAWPRCP
jgi:hypothetical protein